MKKIIAVAACILPISACTNYINDDQYVMTTAGLSVATQKCFQAGLLNSNVASGGMMVANNLLSKIKDRDKYGYYYNMMSTSFRPDAAQCRTTELNIMTAYRQMQANAAAIAAANANASVAPAYTGPTNTWCNKIGTQTFCTTN